eukprot:CAMPEP_0197026734 /NCGR_PEP_ID=MMETSP1384-20130603/6764_1 /TAXON_ID=29189 /ORGANISM="Ammonia sp." /LENGTH=103 /DNA_ID=CAMNT_0042455455 /DNA_START=282 /DNA_END=593 /DNA_ORIENTATION=-
MKTISKTGDASLNGYKLNQQGYDSVCIPRDNGYEYVVYHTDQIKILSYSGFSMETHRCSKCKRNIPDHMAVGQKLCTSCQSALYLSTMIKFQAHRSAMDILFK